MEKYLRVVEDGNSIWDGVKKCVRAVVQFFLPFWKKDKRQRLEAEHTCFRSVYIIFSPITT